MAVFGALFGLLLAGFVAGQTVDVNPREAVRRAGDDVTVLCKVAYPIDSCRMKVGSVTYRLKPSDTDEDVIYTGRGLQYGECGAHIKRIREDWNGNVTCVLPPQTGSIEVSGSMKLVVARPPSEPQLLSPTQPIFREGDLFNAQCIVPNGRPVARITWMIDDKQTTSGVHEPRVISEPGTDLFTIYQNFTRTLSPDDNGRRIVCKAEHEAMEIPRIVARQLSVHYPPKRLESGGITIFGLKIESEGRLNVTIRSNPAPQIEWTVGDQRLTPSRSSVDGSIVALEPVHLGNGYYNCSLLLTSVQKEDVDRVYYLRVHNDLGSEEFAVRLSTLDEPSGMELGTGAIVGIVLGVLVLLLAVFLVVFAKATDRWCFGVGRRRDTGKNSGESSDTESAVAGPKVERSRLAEFTARVRAVLPKKDKVQSAEAPAEQEEKPLSDEKKGVVYAELALGETGRDKPAPPSTEYAEIVYNNAPTESAPTQENKE